MPGVGSGALKPLQYVAEHVSERIRTREPHTPIGGGSSSPDLASPGRSGLPPLHRTTAPVANQIFVGSMRDAPRQPA
jgi:hypothetical protein